LAGFLYGFGPAAVNIPANAVQGTAGFSSVEVLNSWGATYTIKVSK